MAELMVPISPGELIDKITILEIKSAAHDATRRSCRTCAPSSRC